MSEAENQELTFAKRLKAETTGVHDSVDNLVMSVQPFSSKENYIKFLKLQSVFHKAVDHIYKDAELNKAIPELEYMARYCAEGSNLGAAFLFKHAQKLDYNGEHGARHLAPHPAGRGKHWRAFVEHLNALNLTPEAEAEAIQGAREAFAFYKVVLRETFGLAADAEAPEGMMPHRH